MKKSTIALAGLFAVLVMPILSSAHADDAKPAVHSCTHCVSCKNHCNGCKEHSNCKGCQGASGCKACKSCSSH